MIYEIRKKEGSDMLIRDFFARLGMEEVWNSIRHILGDPKTFIFCLLISLALFLIARRYDSVIMQIISGIVFFGLLIFQIILI